MGEAKLKKEHDQKMKDKRCQFIRDNAPVIFQAMVFSDERTISSLLAVADAETLFERIEERCREIQNPNPRREE